jgi:hypothetical protein
LKLDPIATNVIVDNGFIFCFKYMGFSYLSQIFKKNKKNHFVRSGFRIIKKLKFSHQFV